ncbi:MAG: hypothetical protein OXG81_00640 [Acidobacteria bacterium]|nr:hypothetical protein [Acidobacteriota bacterium]
MAGEDRHRAAGREQAPAHQHEGERQLLVPAGKHGRRLESAFEVPGTFEAVQTIGRGEGLGEEADRHGGGRQGGAAYLQPTPAA